MQRRTRGTASTEFASFVDGSGGLRSNVAGYSAGEGELSEQAAHARFILGDVGIDFAVGALEPRRGDRSGPAVAGSHDVDHVEVSGEDRAVEVRIDEVEARRGAPVTE